MSAPSSTDPTSRMKMKERGIKPVIPPKSNRAKAIRYSKRLYRQRNCIERVFGHLKINRAIATRYDQLAESFLGMYSSPRLGTGSNLSMPHSSLGHHGLRSTFFQGRRTWDGLFSRLHCWRACLAWHSGRLRRRQRSRLAESCALA
jgi:hypothetical protein